MIFHFKEQPLSSHALDNLTKKRNFSTEDPPKKYFFLERIYVIVVWKDVFRKASYAGFVRILTSKPQRRDECQGGSGAVCRDKITFDLICVFLHMSLHGAAPVLLLTLLQIFLLRYGN